MQQLSAVKSTPLKKKRQSTLPAIHPNPGTAAAYRRKLDLLLGEMHNSVHYWIGVAYRQNEPNTTLAMDEAPAAVLGRILTALARRWNKKIKDAAPELAAYFATSTKDRADGALKLILKKSGFSVSFQTTPAARDAFIATVGENVSLIKSIGAQYLSDVEQAVMRSVAAGRDLQSLYDEIGDKVDLSLIGKGRKPGESDKSLLARTRRRAALIARDQNNKATATILRVRQQGLGITQAVWLHSAGGKEPRPEHVGWGKEHKRYDLAKGMWSEKDQKYVWPGTAINCRCVSRPVIPGFEDDIAQDSMAQDATWVEAQHPRDANGQFATVSNGHTKPKEGTLTGKVWELANELSNAKNAMATSAEVKAAGEKAGLHPGTVGTQYHHWKKFFTKLEGATAPSTTVKAKKPVFEKKEIDELKSFVEATTPPPTMSAADKISVLDKQLKSQYGFEYDADASFGGIAYYKKGSYQLSYLSGSGSWGLGKTGEDGTIEPIAHGAGYLNALDAVENEMGADAPAKPESKKVVDPSNTVSSLDQILPAAGYKKEGTFSGIHYYIKGDYKASYKPSTNSWALLKKKGDGKPMVSIVGGPTFDGVKNVMDDLGATHAKVTAAAVQSLHKAESSFKKNAEPVPVEEIGYKDGIPHTDHLSATIKSSITTYTGSSYRGINNALRTDSTSAAPATLKHIANIQKAFKQSPPTKQETVVKRGFDFDGLKGMAEAAGLASIEDMKVGMTLLDKGFVSTTHHEKASFGSIKTEIVVPKGAKALHIAPISLHKGENETLLPSGSKFVIESIDKHAGTGHISSLRLRMVV